MANSEIENGISSTEALPIIAKTLALIAMRNSGAATLDDRAAFLNSVGFNAKAIAVMLESSVTTIAPILSKRKKQPKRKKRSRAS